MCSGKLFYHETVYSCAGADLARHVQKYPAAKGGEGGHGSAAGSRPRHSPCPRERAAPRPHARPPRRRVIHVTTSVCLSVRPPVCQILPLPPAPLSPRSPVKPLPSCALGVAEHPWRGSAPAGPRCHPVPEKDRGPSSESVRSCGLQVGVGAVGKQWRGGEGFGLCLPRQLRSLRQQVIFVPTHPTDSSGLNAQAVPSPSSIDTTTTGPPVPNQPLPTAGQVPRRFPRGARDADGRRGAGEPPFPPPNKRAPREAGEPVGSLNRHLASPGVFTAAVWE